MTDRGERIAAAAKAAFPELWPEDADGFPGAPTGSNADKVGLAFARQQALTRTVAAIEAFEGVEGEQAAMEAAAEQEPLADFTIAMPNDAAMIQQVLTTICYITNEGRTAYVVRTMGEGLRTTWLGMCVLAQDYLLKLPTVTQEGD